MKTAQTILHAKMALFWSILGALSTMAVLPYVLATFPVSSQAEIPIPLPVLAVIQGLQSGVLLFVLSWLGLYWGQAVQLDSPLARTFISERVRPTVSKQAVISAILIGFVCGSMIIGLDIAFRPFMPPMLQPIAEVALWKRFLSIFYGGIVEELMMRLFLMTLIVWLIWRIRGQVTPFIYGVALVTAAVLFALAHLPAVVIIWPLTTIVIIRTIILNIIGGLPFGWLYWRWGLEYAMMAHLIADIVLHVIGGN